MGRRLSAWRSPLGGAPEIDLLTTAFGIPSGRELALASRRQQSSTRYISKSDETSEEEASLYSSDDESTKSATLSFRTPRVTRSSPAWPKRRARSHGTLARLLSSRKSRGKLTSKHLGSTKRHSSSRSISSVKDAGNNSAPRSSLKPGRHRTSSISIGCQTSPKGEVHGVSAETNSKTQPLTANHAVPVYLYTQFPYTVNPGMTVPHPIYQPTAHTLTVPRAPRDNRFHNLERLQQYLNKVRSKLETDTANRDLQTHEADLQKQLNNMVESIVSTKAAPANMKSTPLRVVMTDGRKRAARFITKSKTRDTSAASPVTIRTRAHRRSDSASSVAVRHHLCSGCGNIRSRDFHNKYPLDGGRRRTLNLCSACRQEKPASSSLKEYHFCSGCGHVRSKAFQRRHEVVPTQEKTNYCTKCTSEVKSSGRIPDVSMLDLGYLGAGINMPQHENAEVEASAIVGISERRSNSRSQSEPMSTVSNTKTYEKTLKSSPATPAIASPFFPGRQLGSSHRRAQRTLADERRGDESIPCVSAHDNAEYVAPYVEEVTSPTKDIETETAQSRQTDTLRSASQTARQVKSEPTCSKVSPSRADEGAPRSRSSTSSGSKTVRSPSRAAQGKKAPPSASTADQSPTVEPQISEARQETHSYRGAFSTLKTSAFNNFGQSTFDHCSPSQARPSSRKGISRKRSPLAECDSNSRIPEEEEDAQKRQKADAQEPPYFRSSKGAFDQTFMPWEQEAPSQPSCGSMYDRFRDISGDTSTGYQSRPNQDTSTRWSSHASTTTGSDGYTKRHPCAENSSTHPFTAGTDENPYYQPPSKEFREFLNSGSFYSGWSWGTRPSRRENNTNRSHRRHSADECTDPIVEEPCSPPESPSLPPTLLLEFNIVDDTDSSSTVETDSHIVRGSSSCDAVSSMGGSRSG